LVGGLSRCDQLASYNKGRASVEQAGGEQKPSSW